MLGIQLQRSLLILYFFFFNDTATTEIYTLSLHDALPISSWPARRWAGCPCRSIRIRSRRDGKSTRLNSSHSQISYAVFCLKKKKKSYSVQSSTEIVHPSPASNIALYVLLIRRLNHRHAHR